MTKRCGRAILLATILLAAACGGPAEPTDEAPAAITVDYPLAGSIFPPEFVPPTFLWHDGSGKAEFWRVTAAFGDGGPELSLETEGGPPPRGEIDPLALRENNRVYEGTEYQRSAESWTPPPGAWAEIKRRSVGPR